MAYIGPQPKLGQNREVDDISSGFNGSTTAFTLQVGGSNASPGSANNIIVSVNSVVLNPNTAYTVNGSTITFTSAPTNGHAFFGLILGQGIDSGEVSNGSVSTVKLADDAVTSAKIADDAVVAAAIADNAVVTAAINADAVTAAKLADNAVVRANISDDAVNADKITAGGVDTNALGSDSVTTVKILNANVTTDKLADNAVTTAKIADDAVTGAKMGDGSVGTDQIVNGAITGAKMGSSSVGTSQIVDGSITGAKMGASSVGTSQIVDDAVTLAKMADNSVTTANIVAEAVNTGQITDGAITAVKLASGVGGKILQVVHTKITNAFTYNGTSFGNVGISGNITPSSTSSKILVMFNISAGSNNNGNRITFRVSRTGDDNDFVGDASGSRSRASAQMAVSNAQDIRGPHISYVSSPSSTSQVTYALQARLQVGGGSYVAFGASGTDGNNAIDGRTPQHITLIEIAG